MKPPRPFDLDDPSTLPIVRMVSAGDPIHDGQVNRAWTAMVQTPGSNEPAISVALKYLPSRIKLSIELACSLAGLALKLPVPRGMLVLANPADLKGLPNDAASLPGRPEILCYGSLLRWPERARVRSGDPSIDDFIWDEFCKSAAAMPGAAWDELVANADRHAGNFVYDGKYWLIDHDLALKPLAESISRLVGDTEFRLSMAEHKASRNQVATQLLGRNHDPQSLLMQPKALESRMGALNTLVTRMPAWRTKIEAVDDVMSDAETVVRGIILRLPALAILLNDRISKPGSSLQWTTKSKTLF